MINLKKIIVLLVIVFGSLFVGNLLYDSGVNLAAARGVANRSANHPLLDPYGLAIFIIGLITIVLYYRKKD